MKAHQAVHPVATQGRVLGLSPSGYYAWRRRGPSPRAQADAVLTERIHVIHTCSRGTYGAPRVHAELAAQGTHVGRKRIARLMRAAHVAGVSRRRHVWTTRRDPAARPAPDLVQRAFTAEGPNRLWVADITYIATGAGSLYLAVVLDAWSRRVVGWAMATHLRTELVLDALNMAVWQRRPRQVIHHSDQGRAVHVPGLRAPLPGGGRPALDGLGRGRLRQRPLRELLRDPRVRAPRPPALRDPDPGADRGLRLPRGLVQPAPSALRARLRVADAL